MAAAKSVNSVKSAVRGKSAEIQAALNYASGLIKDSIRRSRSNIGAQLAGGVIGCILGSLAFGQCAAGAAAGIEATSNWNYDDEFSKSEWGTYYYERGYAAEAIIADALQIPSANRGVQVTGEFSKTIGKTKDVRHVDMITESGVAIEVKVGSATLTTQMKNQIIKDLQLIGKETSGGQTVNAVTWVFIKSPEGKAPDPATLAFLKQVGIDYQVVG